MLLGNTLARIRHFEQRASRNGREGERDAAALRHGVHGVLAEIFYHPLEERLVHAHRQRMRRRACRDGYVVGRAARHIVYRPRNQWAQVCHVQFGFRADF